jgi:ketosteroid isomerase-like protein
MSQENVDRLRPLLQGWNPGDEVDMSLLDPAVVYEDTILPDHVGETYRGYEGVVRATKRWLEAYEQVTVELERVFDAGDHIVSIHRARSRARHTGIESELRFAYLWTFRDGRVIHIRSVRDPQEALEAAGLPE